MENRRGRIAAKRTFWQFLTWQDESIMESTPPQVVIEKVANLSDISIESKNFVFHFAHC